MPRVWTPGTFGTGAYFIRPWYAEKLVDTGYKEGKWVVRNFKSLYVQPLADSILYSNTKTISLQLFGALPAGSNILPNASYPDTLYQFSDSWKKGLNNVTDIKAALERFKSL